MSDRFKKFLSEAEAKTFDLAHRQKINFNIGKYNVAVREGLEFYKDHETARARASFIKTQTIENLDKYLIEFEKNFLKNGGKVIWARDAEEALREITTIVEKKHAKLVVKAKSMTTEEIGLNERLEHYGVEVVETDLGEYIVQLAGQKPYHIVTPAMHMSKKDVSELFHEKLKIPPTDDAEILTLTARKLLRDKYRKAEIGITGANFLIADTGSIALTENEGNARLCSTFPKTHIVIAGIEKTIPSMEDLDLFWPLLATSGTGQNMTVYGTVVSGPRKPDERDGPEEMIVVLLDNGRTELMSQPDKRQALNCIRCGACLNVCPVYRNIGGHTYDTPYSGPIGSIISPHYEGMEQLKHLSYASSLCGACTSVCPVKIDLHELLLLNRHASVTSGYTTKTEKFGFRLWRKMMLNRKKMNMAGVRIKNTVLRFLFKKTWNKRHSALRVAPKSFNELWKEKNKIR